MRSFQVPTWFALECVPGVAVRGGWGREKEQWTALPLLARRLLMGTEIQPQLEISK